MLLQNAGVFQTHCPENLKNYPNYLECSSQSCQRIVTLFEVKPFHCPDLHSFKSLCMENLNNCTLYAVGGYHCLFIFHFWLIRGLYCHIAIGWNHCNLKSARALNWRALQNMYNFHEPSCVVGCFLLGSNSTCIMHMCRLFHYIWQQSRAKYWPIWLDNVHCPLILFRNITSTFPHRVPCQVLQLNALALDHHIEYVQSNQFSWSNLTQVWDFFSLLGALPLS